MKFYQTQNHCSSPLDVHKISRYPDWIQNLDQQSALSTSSLDLDSITLSFSSDDSGNSTDSMKLEVRTHLQIFGKQEPILYSGREKVIPIRSSRNSIWRSLFFIFSALCLFSFLLLLCCWCTATRHEYHHYYILTSQPEKLSWTGLRSSSLRYA